MSRRLIFGSLCSMVFLMNFGRVVFAALIDHFMIVFSVGSDTIGVVATLVWVGTAVPRIPTGYLLTYIPRDRMILGTAVVLAIGAGITVLSNSVVVLGVGAFVIGVAGGIYFVSANPLISDLFPGQIGRMIGIHGTASQTASVVAPLFVAVVLIFSSWQTVFVFLSLGALASGIIMYTISRESSAVMSGDIVDRDFMGAIRRQWPIIMTGIGIVGATGFVWMGLFNFYVSYLTTVKLLDQATARLLLTLIFAAGVPAFWFSGRLADSLPHIPFLFVILGSFILGLLGLIASEGLIQIVVITVLLGYVIHSLFPVLDSFMLNSLPNENRASAYAVFSGGALLVEATGSSVVGTLVERGYTYDSVFTSFAVGLVIVLGILIALYYTDRLSGVN
ncbi:MAG: MFS transporter [Halobacteria archaeon]|nr:MFS transporter [Halobacteria archaeon]